MTKGDRFASGKGGGKTLKLLRVRQDYLYSLFFGGKFKKWFALLFSTHYMREF